MNLNPLTDAFPMQALRRLFDIPTLLLFFICAACLLDLNVGCTSTQQRTAENALRIADQSLQEACESMVLRIAISHKIDVAKATDAICKGEAATRKLRESLLNGQVDLAQRAAIAFPELTALLAELPPPDRPGDAGAAQ